VQLTGVKCETTTRRYKGAAANHRALFDRRINALVASPQGPLPAHPSQCAAENAPRRADAARRQEGKPNGAKHVDFELTATFRRPAAAPPQLRLLQELRGDAWPAPAVLATARGCCQ